MAVTFDANATTDTTNNAVPGGTGVSATNLTVGSGSNRVLLVHVVFSNQAVTSVVLNWDNAGTPQALTLIKSANCIGATGRADLYGLVNPTAGAKTLKLTWNAVNSDVCMNGVSWTGADQTGGVTSFPHSTSANGNSGTASLVVTSATNNATMVTVDGQGNLSAPTQTQTFLDSTPASMSGGGSRAAGAATVTHQFTVTAANDWVCVGCDIAIAGAAAAFVPHTSVYPSVVAQ